MQERASPGGSAPAHGVSRPKMHAAPTENAPGLRGYKAKGSKGSAAGTQTGTAR